MTKFTLMCCGDCGIEFQVPDHFYNERYKTGKGWSCPNGHNRAFKESEADKLRRERDRLKQDAARLEDERREAVARAERAEKAHKKLKKRTAAGTCPCCKRTFSNMSEHMKHQHPEFVTDSGAKVVPIKRSAQRAVTAQAGSR